MTDRASGGVPMQARRHVKTFLWLFLQGALCTAAVAQQDRTVSDPIELSKLLHSIPAYRGDLGSRFTAGGMTVRSVWINKLTRDDVAEDPQSYALGDIELHFVTDKPDVPDCRILGSPVILKRGRHYIAQDRTGRWLLTGKCDF